MRTVILFIGRWALSLPLVYGVYSETGKWTAIFALLVLVVMEIQGWINNRLIKRP